MSNKLHLSVCHYEQVVVPSGERLRGEGRYGVFAGRTVMHVTTLEIVSRSVTIQMHNFTFFTWMASRRVELIWQFCWSYGASRGFSAVADVLVECTCRMCVCVTFDQLSVRCQVYVRQDVHWTLCQSQAISTSTRLVHHLTLFQSDQEYSHCDKKLARSRAFSYWTDHGPYGPTSETNVYLAPLLGNNEIIHDFAMTVKFCLFSFFNDKFISPN